MSKQEYAYRILRERLIDGVYEPGDRLVIDTLASELAVSAIPIREAVRRLEAEGWLVVRPHVGVEVAPVPVDDWLRVLEVLSVLEGRATALAAPHLDASDIAALRAINERLPGSLADGAFATYADLNREFHAVFHERCGEPWLQALLHDMQAKRRDVSPGIFALLPARAAASHPEHEEIVAAIERGAPAAEIERLARAHKMHTIDAFQRAQATLAA